MTARIFASLLAMAALLAVPGPAARAETGDGTRLVENDAPLDIPGEIVVASEDKQSLPENVKVPGQPGAFEAMKPPAAQAPAAGEPTAEEPQAGSADGEDGDTPDSEISLGEIPLIETMELTPDIAKRALDSYIAAKEKYANSDLFQFEDLQDFVDQTEDGKNFEADIKAAGFANVNDWNLAITTLGLAYGAIVDDQSADLLDQIKEVEQDTEMAQDIKDRMIKAMKAMIPSDNNKKIVEDLINDPVYGEKLKLLDIEEE